MHKRLPDLEPFDRGTQHQPSPHCPPSWPARARRTKKPRFTAKSHLGLSSPSCSSASCSARCLANGAQSTYRDQASSGQQLLLRCGWQIYHSQHAALIAALFYSQQFATLSGGSFLAVHYILRGAGSNPLDELNLIDLTIWGAT